jgi:RNA polymerase sigma factor (TIGR02999 family)
LSNDRAYDLARTVYEELRAIAHRHMQAERPSHTLSATALVHEAVLRLNNDATLGGAGTHADPAMRRQFFRAAAEAMRRILIEHARSRERLKRGGGPERRSKVSLSDIGDVADLTQAEHPETVLALDAALERLVELDERFGDVVRLRFFAGLSVDQTAELLGVSPRTVNNDWLYARAWLARELERASPEEPA